MKNLRNPASEKSKAKPNEKDIPARGQSPPREGFFAKMSESAKSRIESAMPSFDRKVNRAMQIDFILKTAITIGGIVFDTSVGIEVKPSYSMNKKSSEVYERSVEKNIKKDMYLKVGGGGTPQRIRIKIEGSDVPRSSRDPVLRGHYVCINF